MGQGMSWTRIAAAYGLRRPYDFRVAIPFLLAALLLALGGLAFVAAGLRGMAPADSPRFIFFVYVNVLFLGALALSRLSWVSIPLLALGSIEFFLALTTHVGHHYLDLLAVDLLPSHVRYEPPRFIYHPLLGGVPRPGFTSRNGIDVRHNSLGMRGPEFRPAPAATIVNVYGGSTTYDVGSPTGSTWPEQLAQRLSDRYAVANFGVLGYGTVEHIIQASLYRDRHGFHPDYAIYYIGWNDIRNAHLPNLDSGFADYHFPSQFDNLKLRRNGMQSFSPILRILERLLTVRLDTIPQPPEYRKLPPMSGTDVRLESLFRRNIETLVVINRGFGVRPVFIGQVLNRGKLIEEKTDAMFGWVPRVLDRDLLPLQERFNGILREECTRLGVPYIGVPMDRFGQDDFVDVGHFSASGSRRFAELISEELKQVCPPVSRNGETPTH